MSNLGPSDINVKVLIAFYKAYAPEKTEQDALKIVHSGMTLRDLNEKLKIKYGADLSVVSPLSPMMLRRPGSDLPASKSGVPAAQTMDKSLLVMRKGELVDYYTFHDPGREDVEDRVDRLFEKYSFDSIKSALITKYGVLPPGW